MLNNICQIDNNIIFDIDTLNIQYQILIQLQDKQLLNQSDYNYIKEQIINYDNNYDLSILHQLINKYNCIKKIHNPYELIYFQGVFYNNY